MDPQAIIAVDKGIEVFNKMSPEERSRVIDILALPVELPAELAKDAASRSMEATSKFVDKFLSAMDDPVKAKNLTNFSSEVLSATGKTAAELSNMYLNFLGNVGKRMGTVFAAVTLAPLTLAKNMVKSVGSVKESYDEYRHNANEAEIKRLQDEAKLRYYQGRGGMPMMSIALVIVSILFIAAVAYWVIQGHHLANIVHDPVAYVIVALGTLYVGMQFIRAD